MRIVLVEDSEFIRKQFARLLESEPDLQIIGQAASEEGAVDLIGRLNPDVALVDLGLAEGSGLRVMERLRRAGYAGKLFVLSGRDQDFYEYLCAKHGADGFYDKAHGVQKLIADLRALQG